MSTRLPRAIPRPVASRLPFHVGPQITYSELQVILSALYATRGPDLVVSVLRALDALEEDEFEALSQLNDLSIELGALNSVWDEFSVTCFVEYMDAARRAPDARRATLRASFEATIAQLGT